MEIGSKYIKKNNMRRILVPHGEINELAKLMNVSRVTVRHALYFRINSEISKKVRCLAIKRGGVEINN